MNKAELVEALASKSGESKAVCEKVLDSFTVTVQEKLKAREEIKLAGFGKFTTREMAPRTGRNPATGAEIQIAGYTKPVFEVSDSLKDNIQ